VTIISPGLDLRKKCSCGNIAICACGGCAIHCSHPEPPTAINAVLAASIMQSSLNFRYAAPHRGRAVNKNRTYDKVSSPAAELHSYVFDHMEC